MERRKINCGSCKHETLPSGIEPCCNCVAGSEWEAKATAPEAPAGGFDFGGPITGIDIGMPDGTKIPVKIDDDESGPEMIGPKVDIKTENLLNDGHMVETARAIVKQITRLAYAIKGVRSEIGSIGIRLTDKDMSRDEIAFLVGQLNALQADLFELEEEREAAEHVKNPDA